MTYDRDYDHSLIMSQNTNQFNVASGEWKDLHRRKVAEQHRNEIQQQGVKVNMDIRQPNVDEAVEVPDEQDSFCSREIRHGTGRDNLQTYQSHLE